ncbi:MAG TPA: hypothetical protein VEU76_04615, partial [Candidatus Udaeobacter sp.]|nr:hypothetical protein [Candidatus Udaeobacter sp.]
MAHAIRRPAVTAGSPVSSTFNWLYNLRPGALAALYAVVSYAVLIALAASALVLASSGIYQQADQRLAASASASAEYVDQRLESRVGLLNFVASRSALIAALSAGTVDQAGLATVQSSLNQLLTATDLG